MYQTRLLNVSYMLRVPRSLLNQRRLAQYTAKRVDPSTCVCFFHKQLSVRVVISSSSSSSSSGSQHASHSFTTRFI